MGDPRFATNPARVQNMAEVDAMVTDWLSAMTREEAVAATRKFGVPAAPVRDLDEVINDAGMHERGMLHWVEHPEVGRVCLPSSPLRFSDAPAPALKPSPFLNQHEEEVLGGIFGFSAEQRAALREAGAISTAAQVKG
jgi:crotonobetainyl-CoA:carnitine CoA-transferase CaiB-like acyl-CoA transferase